MFFAAALGLPDCPTEKDVPTAASAAMKAGRDIIYLFQSDVCGEGSDRPRHARAFGNLQALHERIRAERREALSAFRDAVEEWIARPGTRSPRSTTGSSTDSPT